MHTGIGAWAIGAIELAVWDLAGRRANLPVWALLQNDQKRPTPIRIYSTCFHWSMNDHNAPNLAAHLREKGWGIQKWRALTVEGFKSGSHRLVDAAGGCDALAVDLCGRWSFDEAAEICTGLPPGLAWIEEPTPPWLIFESRRLPLSSPLAAGEHCYSPQDAHALQEAGCDIWQPDAVFCGGYNSLIAIAAAAKRFDRKCFPHGGGFLAAAHAAAAGFPVDNLEWHLTLEPMRQAHVTCPIVPEAGTLQARPDAPGWAGKLYDE